MTIRRRIESKFFVLAALLILLVGCVSTQSAEMGPTEAAVQLPEVAVQYMELSRTALADELKVARDEIETDSITTPAEEAGVYIVVLEFDGQQFTYHGQGGDVQLVSASSQRQAE